MAKYPSLSPKVLNASGHVPMKAQMSHAAAPHTSFQEGGAPGTRSMADCTHGMANGGPVIAQVGNPAAPGIGFPRASNPVTASTGSARPMSKGAASNFAKKK